VKSSDRLQLVWGGALVVAGVGVFFRIPAVMPRIESIPQFAGSRWFILFCFVLLGLLLIGGGVRKLRLHWPSRPPQP
jgi:hypothetical protein